MILYCLNCTSIGLKSNDKLGLDFSNIKNKIFYDIIYRPKTKFLIGAEGSGNQIIDGKMMFYTGKNLLRYGMVLNLK